MTGAPGPVIVGNKYVCVFFLRAATAVASSGAHNIYHNREPTLTEQRFFFFKLKDYQVLFFVTYLLYIEGHMARRVGLTFRKQIIKSLEK